MLSAANSPSPRISSQQLMTEQICSSKYQTEEHRCGEKSRVCPYWSDFSKSDHCFHPRNHNECVCVPVCVCEREREREGGGLLCFSFVLRRLRSWHINVVLTGLSDCRIASWCWQGQAL